MLLSGSHITAELSTKRQGRDMATFSSELLLLLHVERTIQFIVNLYFALGLLYRAQAGSD